MLKYGLYMFSFGLFSVFGFWWLHIYCLVVIFELLSLGVSLYGFWSMTSYSWGSDYLALIFIFLTICIIILMLLASQDLMNASSIKFFIVVVWSLQIFLIIVFSSNDLFMFYIFFEGSIIPMVVLILGWRFNSEHLVTVFYLIIYTISSSLPLLFFFF